MKFAALREFALSLPDVTEAPHHHFASFRVHGRIFLTVPPSQEHVHVFLPEEEREQALVLHPGLVEKVLWGGKVVAVRLALVGAPAWVAEGMIRGAWLHKAPSSLRSALR